jgi:NTP pyrophosphatase (non-canonical NTP hydrolase)
VKGGEGQGRPAAPITLKTLALPRLDGLSPTLESTALKLMEEAGELGAAIGKYRGLSGERAMPEGEALRRVALELLDVAQTAITMMFVLEDTYGIDVEDAMRAHLDKLRRRGYLTPPDAAAARPPQAIPGDGAR